MRLSIELATVFLIVALAPLPAAQSADWPTAAHDAGRSGRTADLASPPYRQAWVTSWDGENIATVCQLIVAQGRGYIGTLGRPANEATPVTAHGALRGKIHAIDLAGGKDLWTFDDLEGGIAHTLTWDSSAGGTVFAATTGGEVAALDAATGKLRWRFATELGGFSVNPCL